MRKALSIVLAGFFCGCLLAPLPLAGQACQGVAVATGSPSVWLASEASEDGTDKLTVGGRYTGERLYGEATVGRVASRGYAFQSINPDGSISITQSLSHLLGGSAEFGLILMPTSRWSVCLGAGGLYGASNSLDVHTTVFDGGFFVGTTSESVDGDSSAWETALEASVGFASGESSVFAPRAGISFEYGGQTFGSDSDTYTGFAIDLGTGIRYGRVRGLVTYFRVLTREFSDSDQPPGQGCRCPDGWRLGLGVVF